MLKALAAGLFFLLLVLGALVYAGIRRGWMRNGYFTIPTVILIVLGIYLMFQSIGAVLTVSLFGLHPEENSLSVLALNGVAQLLVMLLGAVLISRAAGQDPFAVFRLEGFSETKATPYLLALPIVLSAQFVGVSISSLWTSLLKLWPAFYDKVNRIESVSDKQLEGLVTAHNLMEFVLITVFVAIIPAFAEETLFRGFAQSNIERSGHRHARPSTALLIASLLFAAIHLSLFKLPGLLVLGLCLGWMAFRTNNLFVGSLGHAMNNGLIVMALFVSPKLGVDTSNSQLVGNGDLAPFDAFLSLVESLPILLACLYLFHRATAHMEARHNAELEIAALHALPEDAWFPDELSAEHAHAKDQPHHHQNPDDHS